MSNLVLHQVAASAAVQHGGGGGSGEQTCARVTFFGVQTRVSRIEHHEVAATVLRPRRARPVDGDAALWRRVHVRCLSGAKLRVGETSG